MSRDRFSQLRGPRVRSPVLKAGKDERPAAPDRRAQAPECLDWIRKEHYTMPREDQVERTSLLRKFLSVSQHYLDIRPAGSPTLCHGTSEGEISQATIDASPLASANAMVVEAGPQPTSNARKAPSGAWARIADSNCGANPPRPRSVCSQSSAQASPLALAHSGPVRVVESVTCSVRMDRRSRAAAP